ncbi:MAG: hypothetical protein R3F50_18260 [Gammaproteobacteria bacterium]
MKFQSNKINAIALGVAMGVSAMAAQAADQPTLQAVGFKPGAQFTGGATINGGASYLTEIPAADAVDVVATIKPDASDVGKQGSLFLILDVPGIGLFTRLSGGVWLPLDLNNLESTLLPYTTKTLEAEESVSILEGLVGEDSNLTDITFSAFAAYITDNNLATLTFTGTPIQFRISDTPAAGCPANTTAGVGNVDGKPICVLSGDSAITSDTHLTANNVYFLDGTIRVGSQTPTANENKITMTIDAGTTLFANSATQSFLLIDRSAKLMANGSAEKPIIFTYDEDDGSGTVDPLNDRGKWGGLILNGRARLNTQSGVDQGEGGTGEYGGGNNPVNTDSSGALTYVQIRYAGQIITEEDELNSLALQGVGSETIIDFINIHNGADDGVEFYGGAVNAKHLVLTGMDDDAVDWTSGWSGNLQHVLVKMTTSGDNCIEADNLGSNPTATPRSIPTVSNLTCIGDGQGMKSSGHAFELKAGTGMNMFNSVIGGTFPQGGEGCIRIAGQETFTQSTSNGNISGLNGTLTMETSLISNACAADLQGNGGGDFTATNWYNAQNGANVGNADLGGPWGWANGWNINSVEPQGGLPAFFDEVEYIGAVKDDTSDWAKGWSFDYEAEAGN